MKEIKYKINLDVRQGGVQQTLSGFRAGEARSRTVCIHLVERGAAYQVPPGCTVTMYLRKPDGTACYSTCGVEGGAVVHTFTSGETAVPGEVLCEVRILSVEGDDSTILSSPQFGIVVEDVLQDDGAIESSNEYSALTEAIADVQLKGEAAVQAAQNANEAAEEVRVLLPGKATTYVLQWTEAKYEEYEAVMEENKAVLEAIENAPVGSCHIVLQDGEKEYPLSRMEYGEENQYYFAAPVVERQTPYEYVVWHKPATRLEPAECGLRQRTTVNSTVMNRTNFLPPATALVSALLDSKVTKETGKGLSANDYTTEEKDKLAGIAEGADSVSFNPSKTEGEQIGTLTINGVDTPLFASAATIYSEATTSKAGLISASDKSKLDGITTNIKNGTSPGTLQGIMGCTANKSGAVAMGQSSTAAGSFSFATGNFAFTSGGGDAAIGHYVRSSGTGQVVVGKYNKEYAGPPNSNDAGGTQFIVGVGTGDTARTNAFRVTSDGYCRGQNAFSGSGADYAEYFEWMDGNPNKEDRRGCFVTLEGDKIRKADVGDDYILGVVSATPALIGNTYSDMWQGMYMTDIFGERLTEMVEVPETVDEQTGMAIPAHTETRFVINPAYDSDQPYAGRNERSEWDAVGIVGQLVVIDDGTCEINGYCRVAEGGTAVKSEVKTKYRVMERLDDTHVKIFIK